MSSEPRILFVTAKLDVGGTELHLLYLLPELSRCGYHITLFALKRGGTLTARFRELGIEVVEPDRDTQGRAGIVRSAWVLFRHMLSNRYDVVHYYLPAAYIVGAVCTLATSRAWRIMSRRSLNRYQDHKPISKFAERTLHRFMHRIVGNSQAILAELSAEGVSPSKLVLIHNGVRQTEPITEEKKAQIRQSMGISPSACVFINVANLIPYKGHQDMIRALAKANDHLPTGWRALFVGRDTGIGATLVRLSEEETISDHIIWTGERSDASELIQIADVGIQFSHEEGFSNAILEMMAAGLPCIASDVGGNPDAIQHEECGLLVPPGSIKSLSAAIVRLGCSPESRHKLGQAALDRAKDRFSLSVCLEKYLSLYEGLNLQAETFER